MLEPTPRRPLPSHRNPLLGAQDKTLTDGPTDAFVANFRRYSAAETRYLAGRQSAEQLVGEIQHGMCRLVITIGHTDLTHVLLHIAEKIGPCDLVISTWDVATTHLALVRTARDTGALLRVRWVLDCGFVKRDAPIYATLLSIFSRDNVREWRNHAKVLLLGNEQWKVCVFTSANLGSNPRQEHYTIVEEPPVYDRLIAEWIEPAFAKGRPDEAPPHKAPRQAPARIAPTERRSAPWARSLPVERSAARAA
jgi:hypothetical protein